MPFFEASSAVCPLPLDDRHDCLEDLAQPLQSKALASLLEQLELQLGGQLEARGERERRLVDPLARDLDLCPGELDQTGEEREGAGDVLRVGSLVPVRHRLDRPGVEAPAVGQLDETEALAAFDDDVQSPVVEPLDDLDHLRERPRSAKAVVVGVHEAERLLRARGTPR